MKRKQWGLAAALVLVLAVSFCVRALPAFLPSVSEELRPVLQDENGDPYLTEMDSYFYARFAREMAEAGAPFQYNRRSEDPLMGQRYTVDSGQGIPVLLSVLAYYVWRFLSLFFNVRVIQVVRWMGPVMGSLAAVPVFFYVRRRTNIWGGITAALLVGLSLPFVSHTHAGFFDTDMLLAIVPLGFLLLHGIAQSACLVERQARIQPEIVGKRGLSGLFQIIVEGCDVAEVRAETRREVERRKLGGAGLVERSFGCLQGHFLCFDRDVVL